MAIEGGTFHLQAASHPILGRFAVHETHCKLLVGVIHTFCGRPEKADYRYIEAGLPSLTREWAKRYTGAVWFYDSLLAEPRIKSVAQFTPYSLASRVFYRDMLGIPDPFSAHRLFHRAEEMHDASFLDYLRGLSGSFTAGGLLFKLRFLIDHFEETLPRLMRALSWQLVVYVQAGPSAGKVVTFHHALPDPEECLSLLNEQLVTLVQGGHSSAPVTSKVELKAHGSGVGRRRKAAP